VFISRGEFSILFGVRNIFVLHTLDVQFNYCLCPKREVHAKNDMVLTPYPTTHTLPT